MGTNERNSCPKSTKHFDRQWYGPWKTSNKKRTVLSTVIFLWQGRLVRNRGQSHYFKGTDFPEDTQEWRERKKKWDIASHDAAAGHWAVNTEHVKYPLYISTTKYESVQKDRLVMKWSVLGSYIYQVKDTLFFTGCNKNLLKPQVKLQCDFCESAHKTQDTRFRLKYTFCC